MNELLAASEAPAAVGTALAAGVETPAYVYDLAEIRANIARLRAALPDPSGVYYSLKANPHPALLATLRAGGMRPEVSSPGELAAALAAGWPASDALYTGPGKRDRDVTQALRHGVQAFSVDSAAALDQLDRLAELAGVEVRCLLRINDDQPVAGPGLAMTGLPSQFGVDAGSVLAEPERFAGRARVRVQGLHLYTGTNLAGVRELLAQFDRSLSTAVRLRSAMAAYGVALETIDLGGGFGAPFAVPGPAAALTGLRDALERLLDAYMPEWRTGGTRVVFESGRYLVGTAGTLLTRVLDAKRSHGTDLVVLECGINHLGGMSGLRRLPPLNPHVAAAARRGEPRPTLVAGPLCTPLDTWSRAASLPPLRPGDLLWVPNVGAYGLCASLVAFLGHPAPAEVIVDGDRVLHVSRLHLIRKE